MSSEPKKPTPEQLADFQRRVSSLRDAAASGIPGYTANMHKNLNKIGAPAILALALELDAQASLAPSSADRATADLAFFGLMTVITSFTQAQWDDLVNREVTPHEVEMLRNAKELLDLTRLIKTIDAFTGGPPPASHGGDVRPSVQNN